MTHMKKLIFVVDDDAGILEVLGMVLQESNYETVLSTKNGDYIEQKIKERMPDLIILDILLSGHDGRTICKRLKSQEHTKHVPIILISAHPEARTTAFEAGADDFIAKPFDIDDLLDAVERHL